MRAHATRLEPDPMSELIPDDEAWPRKTMALPESYWERLNRVVDIENKKREDTDKPALSLAKVIAYLLRPGLERWEADNAPALKSKR